MMKPSEKAAEALFETGELSVPEVAELIARETGCDKKREEPEVDWRETFHMPLKLKYDGPNGACVASDNGMELSEYSGNSNQRIMAYAHIVACVNRDAEQPEVDWQKSFSLPFAVLPLGAVSCRLVAANSSTISSAERGTAKAAVLAHIAKLVNRDAERAEVECNCRDHPFRVLSWYCPDHGRINIEFRPPRGAWGQLGKLPWKFVTMPDGMLWVSIADCDGRLMLPTVAPGSRKAVFYETVVDHVNNLASDGDGCPNAPDGV